MQDAVTRYRSLSAAFGVVPVRMPTGLICAVETPMDVRGAVVTDRPGEGSFVELEDFPVMVATQTVAEAFAGLADPTARGLMTLEDGVIRLVAIAGADGVYRDGDQVVLETDGTPLAA
jgi:hypothetical protein